MTIIIIIMIIMMIIKPKSIRTIKIYKFFPYSQDNNKQKNKRGEQKNTFKRERKKGREG